MFSHITVGAADLDKAEIFYNGLLKPLGLIPRQVIPDGAAVSLCWVSSQAVLPRFYVTRPFNSAPALAGNGNMVAFLAPSPAAVDGAYEAGIAAGGSCEGKPGERAHYGEGYYGAYLRDLDGNKVHIVYRGDL